MADKPSTTLLVKSVTAVALSGSTLSTTKEKITLEKDGVKWRCHLSLNRGLIAQCSEPDSDNSTVIEYRRD